jgi:hypothetical protein
MRKIIAALAIVVATPLMFATTASAAVHHSHHHGHHHARHHVAHHIHGHAHHHSAHHHK